MVGHSMELNTYGFFIVMVLFMLCVPISGQDWNNYGWQPDSSFLLGSDESANSPSNPEYLSDMKPYYLKESDFEGSVRNKNDIDLAKSWYDKGNALYRQGKYDEAVPAYDEAIRLDPNYIHAWNNKGLALNSQGKYDEAIQAYDEAIRLDPNYANAWNHKGVALVYARQVR